MDKVPFTYGDFDFSFRGRVNCAFAHWSKGGRRNVVTFYLNKMWEVIEEEDTTIFGEDESFTYFLFYFASIDFHEFLHLWIRRNLPNQYIVSDAVENFVTKMGWRLYTLAWGCYWNRIRIPSGDKLDSQINP